MVPQTLRQARSFFAKRIGRHSLWSPDSHKGQHETKALPAGLILISLCRDNGRHPFSGNRVPDIFAGQD